jgi:hypothetical protein
VGLLKKSAFEASQDTKIRPVRLELGGALKEIGGMGKPDCVW